MARRWASQRGVSLVELLVGIVVGLLVVTAASASLLLARGTTTTATELNQLYQQGAHALRVIGIQVRQAGARDIRADPATGHHVIADDFPGFNAQGQAVAGADGAGDKTDQLSVSHQPASGSTARDCLGGVVIKGHTDSTFQVVGQDLRCGAGATPQPMIGNVAQFQLRYRVTTPAGTQSMTAAEVEAVQSWQSVSAVEVCLDLQGSARDHPGSGDYRSCLRAADGSFASAPRDGRLHVVFRQVFDIRSSHAAR